jgi:hypothetical protein
MRDNDDFGTWLSGLADHLELGDDYLGPVGKVWGFGVWQLRVVHAVPLFAKSSRQVALPVVLSTGVTPAVNDENVLHLRFLFLA